MRAPGRWASSLAFSQHLVMQVTQELCALLKVMLKSHPELQVMFIDIQQYKPTWVMGGSSIAPKELDFTSSTTGKWKDESDEPVNLDAMHCARVCPRQGEFCHLRHALSLGKVVHV